MVIMLGYSHETDGCLRTCGGVLSKKCTSRHPSGQPTKILMQKLHDNKHHNYCHHRSCLHSSITDGTALDWSNTQRPQSQLGVQLIQFLLLNNFCFLGNIGTIIIISIVMFDFAFPIFFDCDLFFDNKF